MLPVIDHIEITVRDMNVAVAFYDKLLPLLGFDIQRKSTAVIEEHDKHVVSYEHPQLGFAITSPRRRFENDRVHRRKPGSLHHLAFKAASREEVDGLYTALQTIVAAPREYPEYTPEGYYAVYFKDPDGIKYEVVSTGR